MPEGLNSGDSVIALAAAVRTAAFLAGIVTGGVSSWIVKHKLVITGAFVISGAITGWIVGTVVGKILFPAQAGHVMIVKTGPSSIPAIIKGDVIASLVTGMIICGLAMLFLKADIKDIALPSLCIPIVIGVVLALAASLL
jgi:hypothetical protein